MRKTIITLLLFLSIILVGCKPTVKVDNNVLYDYFLNTKEKYAEADSGHIIMIIEDDGESSVMDFTFNFKDNQIESMKLVLNEAGLITESYVKDGKVYFNIDGEKTYTDLEEADDEVAGYWFLEVTESLFMTLNKSIFNASTLVSHSRGVATLIWDPSKYTFINEDYADEEYFAAEERFNDIKDTIKAIEITINYENTYIKTLESKWTNNDDEESIIKIEFLGTDKQSITYPSDLNSYIAR